MDCVERIVVKDRIDFGWIGIMGGRNGIDIVVFDGEEMGEDRVCCEGRRIDGMGMVRVGWVEEEWFGIEVKE